MRRIAILAAILGITLVLAAAAFAYEGEDYPEETLREAEGEEAVGSNLVQMPVNPDEPVEPVEQMPIEPTEPMTPVEAMPPFDPEAQP